MSLLLTYLAVIPLVMYLTVRYTQVKPHVPDGRETKYNDAVSVGLFWPIFLAIVGAIICLLLVGIVVGIVHMIASFLLKHLGICSMFYPLFDKIPQTFDMSDSEEDDGQ